MPAINVETHQIAAQLENPFRKYVFETVMQRRILKHITNYNILSTEQYGFRLGLRTDNATYKLTTEILNAMNNNLLVGGIFVI